MSGIESIRQNYQESEPESDKVSISDILENEDELDNLKDKLKEATEKHENLYSRLRSAFLKSVSVPEAVEKTIQYFDETGKFFAFDEETWSHITENFQDVENVVEVVRIAVIRLCDEEIEPLSAIFRRRENLNLLAVIMQLREIDQITDKLDQLLTITFNQLCKTEDWSDLSDYELGFLQDIFERINDVPETVKSVIKSLLNYVSK